MLRRECISVLGRDEENSPYIPKHTEIEPQIKIPVSFPPVPVVWVRKRESINFLQWIPDVSLREIPE